MSQFTLDCIQRAQVGGPHHTHITRCLKLPHNSILAITNIRMCAHTHNHPPSPQLAVAPLPPTHSLMSAVLLSSQTRPLSCCSISATLTTCVSSTHTTYEVPRKDLRHVTSTQFELPSMDNLQGAWQEGGHTTAQAVTHLVLRAGPAWTVRVCSVTAAHAGLSLT